MDANASLSPHGLQRFAALRTDAINAVSARFYSDHSSIYARFGEKGREACAEDLGFHLEFLRPVLEFGRPRRTYWPAALRADGRY